MTGRTALDIALNTKARELELFLESPESLPWWGLLGFLVLAILVLYVAVGWIGDLFFWATMSWKRFFLSPFYLLLLVIVVLALYRVGTLTTLIPQSIQTVLEGAAGR